MIALWLALTAQAGCGDQILVVALNQAERAFDENDLRELDRALSNAHKAFGCTYQHITATDSARLHRVEALSAHLHGNPSRAEEALRAMARADPWLGVLDLVDPGHPLAVLAVDAEERGASASRPLVLPDNGKLQIDGVPSAMAPLEHPFVYQQIRASGDVAASAWIASGGATPKLVGERDSRRVAGSRLRAVGLTAGLAAGALYGVAFYERGRYEQAVKDRNNAEIQGTYDTTNALSLGSVIAAGAGGTLIVVGLAL